MPTRIFLLLSALAIALTTACGAHSPRILDERYKTIHVSVVENKTYEVALEESFTRDLIEAFKRDGRLKLTSRNNADLNLDVVITRTRVYPLTYSDLDRAVGYSLDVVVEATVTDSAGNILIDKRPFPGSGVQMLTEDPSTGGLRNVSENIADNIISYLLEGW
ncbi:MAG: hypothetical protein GC154_07780 [bacterium]|nr:hypothetical protein [bacterium]